jgi:microcystin-dependent protein
LLGTTYGGNGQTTFALPNMQGRVPMHFGQSSGTSNWPQGAVSGVESTTLTQQQMPVHTHAGSIQVSTEDATLKSPAGAYLATPGGSTYFNSQDGSTLNGLQIGAAGGSQPFGIMQPFLVVNFIIAINGIFPSRN